MKRKTYYLVTTYNPDYYKTFMSIKKARRFIAQIGCDEYWMIRKLTALKSKFLRTYITSDGKAKTPATERIPTSELIEWLDEKIENFG